MKNPTQFIAGLVLGLLVVAAAAQASPEYYNLDQVVRELHGIRDAIKDAGRECRK